MRTRSALVAALATLASLMPAPYLGVAGPVSVQAPLPTIGPAPDFTLTSQDGSTVSLRDLRGSVVAVAFIFTHCTSTCPVLTPMMSFVQDQLGRDFGTKVAFVSITIDPERDTPDVLKEYALALGADLAGWRFLTGTPAAIRDVTHRYGLFVSKTADDVEHTNLTSIVDRHGMLRVQYLGVRFDPEEFRRDLLSLLQD